MKTIIHPLRSTTGGNFIRFFEPTFEFFTMMAVLNPSRSKVIDCGSSHGLLAKEMNERGYDALGIDLFPSDESVLSMDAMTFNYPVGCIAIIARPCHNDWVEKTIRHALRTAAMVVYISLDHNKDVDIPGGDEFMSREDLGDVVGLDGEVAVIFKRKSNNMQKFCLIKTLYYTGWFSESEEGEYRNPNGGWMRLTSEDKIITTVEAECFEDLDWQKTYLYQPDSKTGWISPSGQFYGCDSEQHDSCAHYVIKKTVREMESAGWIRLHRDFIDCRKEMTPEQVQFLKKRGVKWNESRTIIVKKKPATLKAPHEGD